MRTTVLSIARAAATILVLFAGVGCTALEGNAPKTSEYVPVAEVQAVADMVTDPMVPVLRRERYFDREDKTRLLGTSILVEIDDRCILVYRSNGPVVRHHPETEDLTIVVKRKIRGCPGVDKHAVVVSDAMLDGIVDLARIDPQSLMYGTGIGLITQNEGHEYKRFWQEEYRKIIRKLLAYRAQHGKKKTS